MTPDERRLFHYWTTDDGKAQMAYLKHELRYDEGTAIRPAPRMPIDPYMSLYVAGQHSVVKLIEKWTRESVDKPPEPQAAAVVKEPD